MKKLLLLFLLASGCARPPEITPPEVNVSSLDPSLAGIISTGQQAVRNAPRSGEVWGKLAQAFEAAEFLEQARICYARASDLEPASGRWLYLLSLLQLQGEPGAALTNLMRAVELVPATNDAPRLRLAKALVERGRYAEATPQLEKLLAMNPMHPAARVELARIRLASNDAISAADLLQPALTNAYTARVAHLLLSQVKQRTGDVSNAALLAKRAAAMPRPFDWPDSYLREVQSLLSDQQNLADRANGLMMARRFAEAEAVLNQLVSRAPDHPETLLLLGRLRIQQRRCAEAGEILQRHLAIRTNSLQGLVQLGLARYCESRWIGAAEAFRSALALKPDFAQAHYNPGLALARADDSTGAIDAFRNALRCQPGDPITHAALSEELLRTGRAAEALREADEALRIDPKQAKALRVRESLRSSKP